QQGGGVAGAARLQRAGGGPRAGDWIVEFDAIRAEHAWGSARNENASVGQHGGGVLLSRREQWRVCDPARRASHWRNSRAEQDDGASHGGRQPSAEMDFHVSFR